MRSFEGNKGGGGSFRQRPDTLRSNDVFEGLLGICAGPIKGLTNGLKSLKLNGTPIEDTSGNLNFKDMIVELRDGDPALHPQTIKLNLGGGGSPTGVGLTLTNGNAEGGAPGDWQTASIANIGADFIDLRFLVQQLYLQNKTGVDVLTANLEIELKPTGATTWINPNISVPTSTYANGSIPGPNGPIYVPESYFDGLGNWQTETNNGYLAITGKATSPYVKELRITVPNTGAYANKAWDARVRLIEPANVEADPIFKKRTIAWESISAGYTGDLGTTPGWRGLASIQFMGKATDEFSGDPRIEGDYETKLVKVPPITVYDPETRTYTGSLWDGSYSRAYTNDPAWVINDVISDALFGMSALAPGSYLNKWDALEASKWCSEQVWDGDAGTHPRYSLNFKSEAPQKAKEFVQYLAGAIGGFAWDNGNGEWRLKLDKPEAASDIVTLDTIEGEFSYAHSDVSTRYNDIVVKFLNEEKDFLEDQIRVYDDDAIDLYGRKPITIVAVGCTNRQEAVRRGVVRLRSNLNETHTVSFTTNRRGRLLTPFSTVLIADGDLGYQVAASIVASADNLQTVGSWTNQSSFASVVTATAIPGGNPAFRFTSNNSGSDDIRQLVALKPSTPYTVSHLIETFTATLPAFGVYNSTAAAYLAFLRLNVATGQLVADAVGAPYDLSARRLGPGPNGGVLWYLSAKMVTSATPSVYRLQLYPNGTGANTHQTIVHGIEMRPEDFEANRTTGRVTAISVDRLQITLRDTVRLETGVSYAIRFAIPNPDYNPSATTEPTSDTWDQPTIVLTRNIVSGPGDTKVLTLDAAMPTVPEFLAVALEATGLPTLPKLYRILAVSPSESDPEHVVVSAIEVDSGKWAAADAAVAGDAFYEAPAAIVPPPLAPTSGDVLAVTRVPGEAADIALLTVNWDRPPSRFLSGFKVQYRINGGPIIVLADGTQNTSLELVNPVEGTYAFEIFARDRRGEYSLPLTDSIVVDASLYIPIESVIRTAAIKNPRDVLDAPRALLMATDAGATATISVARHDWDYVKEATDLTREAGSITGLAFATEYYVYFDDATLADATPTYIATTDLANAQNSTADPDRHALGKITTPADGAGDTSGSVPPGYGYGSIPEPVPGPAGQDAASALLDPPRLELPVDGANEVTSYAGATSTMTIRSAAGADITSDFTVTVESNPHALTTSIVGGAVTITGGFGTADPSVTTLKLLATGGGVHTGQQVRANLTIVKQAVFARLDPMRLDLPRDIDGNVTDYTGASTTVQVLTPDNVDVTSSFTISVETNTAGLTTSITGAVVDVTGGFTDADPNSVRLGLLATGTGAYAGFVARQTLEVRRDAQLILIDFVSDANDNNVLVPDAPVFTATPTVARTFPTGNVAAYITYTIAYNADPTHKNNFDELWIGYHAADTNAVYTWGSDPSGEVWSPLSTNLLTVTHNSPALWDKPAHKYYTFAVKVVRKVHSTTAPGGKIESALAVTSPWLPSSHGAYAPPKRRDTSVPPSPTVATDGSAVDHVGGIGPGVEKWFKWDMSPTDRLKIDGYQTMMHRGTTNANYTPGDNELAEQRITILSTHQRAMPYSGDPPESWDTHAVRSFRIVDEDLVPEGKVWSPWVKATLGSENPYRANSNPGVTSAFLIDGTSASFIKTRSVYADYALNSDGTLKPNMVPVGAIQNQALISAGFAENGGQIAISNETSDNAHGPTLTNTGPRLVIAYHYVWRLLITNPTQGQKFSFQIRGLVTNQSNGLNSITDYKTIEYEWTRPTATGSFYTELRDGFAEWTIDGQSSAPYKAGARFIVGSGLTLLLERYRYVKMSDMKQGVQ